MKNIIFLDIDGVLNCQLFYDSDEFNKDFDGEHIDYKVNQISKKRVLMLNDLCSETESGVVISSVWRGGGIDELREIFIRCGATFDIIDTTPYCKCGTRGCEIHRWLYENIDKYFDVQYYDFYRYAIIDDDSDMLLNQQPHFFQTDHYSGLTPTTCYKIKRFFIHKTF